MAITKISREELDAEINNIDREKYNYNYDFNFSKKNLNRIKTSENDSHSFSDASTPIVVNRFIKKLKMKDIVSLFEPYGIVYEENNRPCIDKWPSDREPQFIYVQCAHFDICFDDFLAECYMKEDSENLLRDPKNKRVPSKALLNSSLLYRTSQELGYRNMSDVWSNIIARNLLCKYHGYGEARKSYFAKIKKEANKQARNLANGFGKYYFIPAKVSNHLSALADTKEAEFNVISDKLIYGDTPLDFYANKK